jgi:hypothetical protein
MLVETQELPSAVENAEYASAISVAQE